MRDGCGRAVCRATRGAVAVFPAPGFICGSALEHGDFRVYGVADRDHRRGFAVGHSQRERQHDADADFDRARVGTRLKKGSMC